MKRLVLLPLLLFGNHTTAHSIANTDREEFQYLNLEYQSTTLSKDTKNNTFSIQTGEGLAKAKSMEELGIKLGMSKIVEEKCGKKYKFNKYTFGYEGKYLSNITNDFYMGIGLFTGGMYVDRDAFVIGAQIEPKFVARYNVTNDLSIDGTAAVGVMLPLVSHDDSSSDVELFSAIGANITYRF